jgi:hypothetical protein
MNRKGQLPDVHGAGARGRLPPSEGPPKLRRAVRFQRLPRRALRHLSQRSRRRLLVLELRWQPGVGRSASCLRRHRRLGLRRRVNRSSIAVALAVNKFSQCFDPELNRRVDEMPALTHSQRTIATFANPQTQNLTKNFLKLEGLQTTDIQIFTTSIFGVSRNMPDIIAL